MTVEDAYAAIAQEAIAFAGDNPWGSAGVEMEIYEKMVSSTGWREIAGQRLSSDLVPSFEISMASTKAALFLRDDLLATNGERITGLTFSITKQGKFSIEYKYSSNLAD